MSNLPDGRAAAWVNAWDLMAAAAIVRNQTIASGESQMPELHDAYLDEATVYIQLAGSGPEVAMGAWKYMEERWEKMKAEHGRSTARTRSAFEDIIAGSGMMPEKKEDDQKPCGETSPNEGGDECSGGTD